MTNEAFPSHRFDGAKEVPAITTNSSASSEAKDKVPEWAIGMAHQIAVQVLAEHGEQIKTLRPLIARALVAAEKRGIGYGAAYLERRAAEWRNIGNVTSNTFANVYEDEAAAIRQLGEVAE
ncbi:hypothetical protein [Parvibaculum sp.]|uniref:hypothetical protein n=1 Tax=Parvibaculum sp. TaxID=2024848 RepID=UPI003C74F834